jgi:hypothetical protein
VAGGAHGGVHGGGADALVDGESLHEATALSYSQDGRNRTVMLAPDQVEVVTAAVARYRQAQARLEQQANAGLAELLARAAAPPGPVTGFAALLDLARGGFTAPSFALFTDLLSGWVLAPGRRTITGMIVVGDPGGRRAHDAYHRL